MRYRYQHIGYGPGKPGRIIERSTPLVPVPAGWRLLAEGEVPEATNAVETIEGVAERVSRATLDEQVDRLATFIVERFPGEPAESAGAVDVAIRLLGRLADIDDEARRFAELTEVVPPAPVAADAEATEAAPPAPPTAAPGSATYLDPTAVPPPPTPAKATKRSAPKAQPASE